MKIAIVIPTYNEKENITRLIEALSRVARQSAFEVSFLVVDDDSPDGTAEVVRGMDAEFPVHLLHRKSSRGLGRAYREGFLKALDELPADLFVSMDADFSHDPEALPLLVNKVREGADVAVGSRYVPGGSIPAWSFARKLISASCNFLSRKLLTLPIRDVTSGYRCFSRKVLESLPWEDLRCDGYAFMEEILFYCNRLGFKMAEVPIAYRERTHGETKLNALEILKVFFTLLRLRLISSGRTFEKTSVKESSGKK